MFAEGVGGEILAPMALPVLGGLLVSDEVVDLFLPVRFYWVRRARWLALQEQKAQTMPLTLICTSPVFGSAKAIDAVIVKRIATIIFFIFSPFYMWNINLNWDSPLRLIPNSVNTVL